MEKHTLEELKMLKNIGANAKMSHRKNLNFSEYVLKSSLFVSQCRSPKFFATQKTFLNANIKRFAKSLFCSQELR